MTPAELSAKTKADTTFFERGVKVGARVVNGSIERNPGGRQLACASRYENAPEKYKDTWGYKRAEQRA